MTPVDALETIQLSMVTRAEVGRCHCHPAGLRPGSMPLSLTTNAAGKQIVCGVFGSAIARQPGVTIHTGDTARTFAEIEAVIGFNTRCGAWRRQCSTAAAADRPGLRHQALRMR